MKKFIALSLLVLSMPLSMLAQDDDMYFVPKKKSDVKLAKQTYYVGSDRDVDEYNRRGKFRSSVTPISEDDDIISFDGVAGVYPDSLSLDSVYDTSYAKLPSSKYYADEDDETEYRYSNMLDRWYGVYDPWFYGPGFYGRHFYWHSPYYYSHYAPYYYDPWMFYDYGFYGFYGTYGPWYTGWYDPWYNPWYGHYHGWYYGYGSYPWWGYGGGGGGIAGVPSRSRTDRGSASLKGYAAANGSVNGSRRNSYNDIAKRQAVRESIERSATNAVGRGLGQRNGYRESYNSSNSYNTGSRSTSSSFNTGGGSRSSFSGGGGGGSRGGSVGGGGSAGSHGGRR